MNDSFPIIDQTFKVLFGPLTSNPNIISRKIQKSVKIYWNLIYFDMEWKNKIKKT